ncbi:MAG: histidine phosphatase family protein, partial [Streptosporangiaceae bacterium]
MADENGNRPAPAGPAFRRTDRTDAPYYLARYAERRGLKQSAQSASSSAPAEAGADAGADSELPLYLRRFRERAGSGPGRGGSSALLEVDGERFTSEFAGASRDKEIVAPPERKPQEDFATEIRIIRHGITQGYSTDAGLTPMGGWQSHQRGHSLSKSVRPGQKVRIVCADTSRARQTADQIYRGMTDGLRQWGREADVGPPEPIGELRNFQVWTPE